MGMIGRTISHYRILDRLGEGGMGVVYRAEDLSLRRPVALKFLADDAAGDAHAHARLVREAQAAAALLHPGICPVYEIGACDGRTFIAMGYLEGETLQSRLMRGPISVVEALRIAAQLIEALAVAHRQGIVHHDIKPANVMLLAGARAVLMDFGLASVRGASRVTQTGMTLGTLHYMAPEQVRGERDDSRSDLWSIGVVLYEMLTGGLPFKGEQEAALFYQILSADPVPPGEHVPKLPPGLDAVVARALAKDPARRHPDAAALLSDLRAIEQDPAAMPAGRGWPSRSRWHRAAAGIAMAIVILAGTLLALDVGHLRTRLFARPARIRSIAVLPLVNLSRDADQQFFADGMTDELIMQLSQVASIQVISRGSVMAYRGTRKSIPAIARELHADALVQGSVQASGGRVMVRTELTDGRSGRNLWASAFERGLRDLIDLEQEIARTVVTEMSAKLTSEERQRLSRPSPVDPRAHDAVLRGRFYMNQFTNQGFQRALDSFREAIAIAPEYADAHSAMALGYLSASSVILPAREAMPLADAEARRALELDPSLAEAHLSRAYVRAFYAWEWRQAEPELRRAIELSPSSSLAHQCYGYFLVVNGRFREAGQMLARARELDPLSAVAADMSLWPLYESRHYEEAIAAARRVIEVFPTTGNAYFVMGQAQLMLGRYDEACETWRRMPPGRWSLCTVVDAIQGRRGAVMAVINRVNREEGPAAAPCDWFAALHLAMGDRDSAIAWLHRSVEQRGEDIVFIKVDPVFDPLRTDPRFQAIVRQVFP